MFKSLLFSSKIKLQKCDRKFYVSKLKLKNFCKRLLKTNVICLFILCTLCIFFHVLHLLSTTFVSIYYLIYFFTAFSKNMLMHVAFFHQLSIYIANVLKTRGRNIITSFSVSTEKVCQNSILLPFPSDARLKSQDILYF